LVEVDESVEDDESELLLEELGVVDDVVLLGLVLLSVELLLGLVLDAP
jgi:hypothetical protein